MKIKKVRPTIKEDTAMSLSKNTCKILVIFVVFHGISKQQEYK